MLTVPYTLKLQEIPLYKIASIDRFDLNDPSYNFSKLYKSLLRTGGLDLKNHPPIIIQELFWTGDTGDDALARKRYLEQGFRYSIINGNHRIATLQFINLHKKLKLFTPDIMVKVLVIAVGYYAKLDYYRHPIAVGASPNNYSKMS